MPSSDSAATVCCGGLLDADIALRRPRALVVDDDPVIRELMSALLDERGIDCLAAADGRDGLRRLAEEILTLDLLVTDLVMPGLSGQALVEAVRGQGGERELPILVLSGNLDPGRVDALRAAGADAVVDKAGGLAQAVAAARELLESRGWLRPARSPAAEAPACLCRIALTRTRRD